MGLRHYRSKWPTDEHPGVYRHASTGACLRDRREPQALIGGRWLALEEVMAHGKSHIGALVEDYERVIGAAVNLVIDVLNTPLERHFVILCVNAGIEKVRIGELNEINVA